MDRWWAEGRDEQNEKDNQGKKGLDGFVFGLHDCLYMFAANLDVIASRATPNPEGAMQGF
jgi:hypothetical protein